MIDPTLVRGWLAGRSLSRGLPAPVADHGGWRVDTGGEEERRRYVFAEPCQGLARLAQEIDEPGVFIKVCADVETLRAMLPARWSVRDANCMMVAESSMAATIELPPGYSLASTRDGDVTQVSILSADGSLAASGYAAEADGVFVYDRIVTAEGHRRRGLGRALMATLGAARRDERSRQVLTATAMGAALYEMLGWRVYTPYTTASL